MSAAPATNEGEGLPGPELTRRRFLKVSGALGAAGALSACLPHEDPYALPLEKEAVPGSDKWYRGEERLLASACAQCPVNCGILVRVVEGRAVRVLGNPKSPLVDGKLGPKGQTGHFTLYDPDRIRQPLKRDGARGSGRWKPVSWEEALEEVSERLTDLRGRSEPHRLAVFSGRQRGFMKELLERFCRAYGTPNFFDSLSGEDGPLAQAMELMTGHREIPGYDAANTSYILSLGSGIFESTCNGIHFTRATGKFRRGHPTRRSKIVQVEPKRSQTAAAADEWLPIRPGTYDALALGLAHALVHSNQHDRDFAARHAAGFDHFLETVKAFPPEKASEITGIPVKDIYRLAWELSASKPALVVVDARSTATTNGLEIARCALALNALLGAVERPGGLVTRKEIPLAAWSGVALDAAAEAGLAQPSLDSRGERPFGYSSLAAFPEAVLGAKPYAPEALLLYYSNPLFARNQPGEFAKAFAKIPFIASFSPFLDESAHHADLILPDHTFLERWEEALPPPFGFQGAMGLRRPVVEPLYDTLHSGDALIRIAKTIGGKVAESFPWKNFKGAMEERLGGLADAKRGSIKAESREDFLKKLAKEGYWTDDTSPPEAWKSAFRTASGKFEFHSSAAEEGIRRLAAARGIPIEEVLNSLGLESLEQACLPHAEKPRFTGAESDFPLVLMPYKDIAYAEGSGANIPHLTELSGLQRGLKATESWRSWVELHPDTAGALGLRRDDAVWVESTLGKIKAHVLPTAAVPEGMAYMELGKGHSQYGRFAGGKGANPKELLPPEPHPLTGFSARCNTRVRIAKA